MTFCCLAMNIRENIKYAAESESLVLS